MSSTDQVASLPSVGVVTVTYNGASVLPDFLDSLARQHGATVRLYVVDNNSADDSLALIKDRTDIGAVTFIENDDNRGVAEGNNQGILAALADGCDWVLLLNNDTVFPGDLVATLVDEASQKKLDLLSPVIEAEDPAGTIWYRDGRFLPMEGFRTFHVGQGEPMSTAPQSLTATQYASTCCLLVRPSVFSKVGLMDPDYFVYFDDVDFAVRANRAGYRYWVTPRTVLLHKASSITGGPESPFALRWGSRNWALITRKNHAGPARWWSYAVIYGRSFVRFLTRRDTIDDYRIRLRSFREAITMTLHPVPFPESTKS